jgi:hypothetical protein
VSWHVIPVNGTPTFPLTVPVNYPARYLRIQLRGTGALGLAEVEVSGTPSNLAVRMPVVQSSTWPGGDAWRAVDDNTDGVFANGSVTATRQIDATSPAWWEVNLAGVRAVSAIAVYNRTDCCASNTSNYRVFVSEADTTQSFAARLPTLVGTHLGAASDLGSITRVNGFAQSIRIEIPAGVNLNMAEVKVFGADARCAFGQTAIDGTGCARLTRWDYGSPTGSLSGRRVAIRLRNLQYAATPGERWLGVVNGRVTAVDNDLRSRDVFTLVEYQPSGATGSGLPWFALQAPGGGYVELSFSGGSLNAAPVTTLADAWTFTRGTSAATGNSLLRVVVTNNFGTTDPFIDNRWKHMPEWYSRITTKPASYAYRDKCLAPSWVPSEQRVFWDDRSCTAADNSFDFYFVD